jgi:AraC family transcriptional regulator
MTLVSFNGTALRYYPSLRRVEQYVKGRNLRGISLGEAARIAGLERKYFSAFFRAKTGVRFRDWLRGLRVERAQDVMRGEYARITRVAFAAGFADLRSFERAFKTSTGLTPSEWRARTQRS